MNKLIKTFLVAGLAWAFTVVILISIFPNYDSIIGFGSMFIMFGLLTWNLYTQYKTRISINDDSLVVDHGLWKKHVPLKSIVRLTVTADWGFLVTTSVEFQLVDQPNRGIKDWNLGGRVDIISTRKFQEDHVKVLSEVCRRNELDLPRAWKLRAKLS